MVYLPLTKGCTAIIDNEDADKTAPYTWHAVESRGKFYAATNIRINGKQKQLKLHHLIMSSNQRVDHENGNSLDNRKENLRHCTAQQNSQNQKPRKSITGYKGVTPYHNKFRVQIFAEGKKKYLGLYDTAEIAAAVYNENAVKYFGKFAKLNVIEGK